MIDSGARGLFVLSVFAGLGLSLAARISHADEKETVCQARAEAAVPVVLLADDDPQLRPMFVRALRQEGLEVIEAVDGQAALDLFSPNPGGVNLLVTDVTMPRMNGITLTQRVKALRPDLPVIVVTTENYHDLESILGLAGVELLPKPFRLPRLIERVRAHLTPTSEQPEGTASTPAPT